MTDMPKRKRITDRESAQTCSDRSMMFKAFCAEHHQRLFHWSLRCNKFNQQDAEDVMTELYTLFLEGKVEVVAADEWVVWSFGTIRRLAMSRTKKRVWRQGLLKKWFMNQSDSQAIPEPNQHYEEDQAKAIRIALVHQALEQLSARQKEIMILAMYEDLSLQEIAKVLNLGIGSVRTHYHRAKQKLSTYLHDYVVNHPEAQDSLHDLIQKESTASAHLSLERVVKS